MQGIGVPGVLSRLEGRSLVGGVIGSERKRILLNLAICVIHACNLYGRTVVLRFGWPVCACGLCGRWNLAREDIYHCRYPWHTFWTCSQPR